MILNSDFFPLSKQEAEQKQNQFQLVPNTAGGSITDLKKQTQFSVTHISVNPLKKGKYDNNSLAGGEKNKANQTCPDHLERSQIQTSAQGKGVPKEEISIKAVAG